MQEFERIGDEIEGLWKAAGYDETRLPGIAADALERAALFEKLTPWDVVEWTLAQRELPDQKDLPAKFGDPPITIFNSPRFHIDVYFWLEGTTAIHQHAFCGAFQVFGGSSIHSWYEFETEKQINFFTRTGRLKLRSCDLLEVGAIQKIDPGEQYIHALFHLDQPSATIVVRTHLSPLNQPQYLYLKPGLAVDPFFEEPNSLKKLQALTMALRAGHEKADEYLEKALRGLDFQTSFRYLQNLKPHLAQNKLQAMFSLPATEGRFEKFLSIVCETHEEFASLLREVFEEQARLEHIVGLRRVVSGLEHRFFLALLLNVDDRERIFSLIKQRFPDKDPLEQALDWISELADTRVVGGDHPNALGVEGFDDFDLLVLEEMMKEKSEAEVRESLKAIARDGESIDERVNAGIAKIRGAHVFRALLV